MIGDACSRHDESGVHAGAFVIVERVGSAQLDLAWRNRNKVLTGCPCCLPTLVGDHRSQHLP